MKIRIVFGFGALLGLVGGLAALPQDAKQEYDLTWKLPHDRVAVYEICDGLKGLRIGQFRLLTCELETGIGVNGYGDLPYRFMFRVPKGKVKAGTQWQTKEMVFSDSQGLMAPAEIVGTYSVRAIRKMKVEDIFKTAAKGKKTEPVEVALLEGQCEVFRYNWTNGKLGPAENKSSSTIATVSLVRVADGAFLGVRVAFRGRSEDFTRMMGGPVVTKLDESHEFLLQEPLLELSKKALQEEINQAIQKGMKWLKSQAAPDGALWDRPGYPLGTTQSIGATCLALDALIHSGLEVKDSAIRNGFASMQGRRSSQSYDCALQLVAIEAKYVPSQGFDNAVVFSEDKARDQIASGISKEDKDHATELAQSLMDCQGKHGSFGYTKAGDEPNLSSMQYALLGLKSASRMGVNIPSEVWKRAFLAVQSSAVQAGVPTEIGLMWRGDAKESRNIAPTAWPYYVPAQGQKPGASTLTSTMVTAALTSIALCRSELLRAKEWTDSLEAKANDLIWGGMAWIRSHFSLRAAKPEGVWWGPAMVYYYLYSLERAAVLLGIESIDSHDWYLEGAEVLVSAQKGDGRWEGLHNTPVVDTAFALLFLKRATIPVETPSRKAMPSEDKGNPSPKSNEKPKESDEDRKGAGNTKKDGNPR
jgi:hypothetical protein